MGLDGGQSIGMPKSSSSSKLEFSDSEFVFGGGVKFNGGIDMGEGGRERDGDLGGDSNLGVERGIWGWWRGGSRGDGDLGGGDCDVEGHGDVDLGVGIFDYFPKQGELWERVEGKLVLQGNLHAVERGIWGRDLCLFCQARRVLGESGGGICIAGEPARCSVSMFFS